MSHSDTAAKLEPAPHIHSGVVADSASPFAALAAIRLRLIENESAQPSKAVSDEIEGPAWMVLEQLQLKTVAPRTGARA
jgi:hypothetical protein